MQVPNFFINVLFNSVIRSKAFTLVETWVAPYLVETADTIFNGIPIPKILGFTVEVNEITNDPGDPNIFIINGDLIEAN